MSSLATPSVATRESARPRSREAVLRLLDLFLAVVLLAATSPVSVTVAAVIRSTMGSPVMHRSQRAGRDGAPFTLLKFRTMRPLRPGESIPEDDEKRVTRIGGVLRSTSLDELPSFWNVVRGDMALVGPRPLPVRYTERYSPAQARRLEVRPGITGWAQVNGRNAITWEEKFELDRWYVDHRSLALDLRVLARTLRDVASRSDISHQGHATMPEFEGSAVEPREGGAERSA